MLLEKNGEITSERIKRRSQSKTHTHTHAHTHIHTHAHTHIHTHPVVDMTGGVVNCDAVNNIA